MVEFSKNAENYPLFTSKLLPQIVGIEIYIFLWMIFEEPQRDAISRFYAQVEYIDLIIKEISDYKTSIIEEKMLDLSGGLI